jgi:hypothetical protein
MDTGNGCAKRAPAAPRRRCQEAALAELTCRGATAGEGGGRRGWRAGVCSEERARSLLEGRRPASNHAVRLTAPTRKAGRNVVGNPQAAEPVYWG